MLTQARVKYLFFYNEETGTVTRKVSVSSNARKGDIVNGKVGTHGYKTVSVDGTVYLLHRIICLWMIGRFPIDNPKEDIDHINRDKTDNRWCNLRLVTRSQNMQNVGLRSTNTSGHKGIHQIYNGKYRVSIKVNYKNIHIGYYSTLNDAIAARGAAESKYFTV